MFLDMVESPREEQIKAYVALQAWLRMPATVTRKQEVVSSSPTNVIFWTLGSNTLSMLIQGFYVHWWRAKPNTCIDLHHPDMKKLMMQHPKCILQDTSTNDHKGCFYLTSEDAFT